MTKAQHWFIFRLSVLLAILAVVGGLVMLQRKSDLRLFLLFDFPLGRWVSQWMPLARTYEPVEEKMAFEWSSEEYAIRDELLDLASGERPTHLLTLTDGTELQGRVVSQSPELIEFSQDYGDSGGLAVRFSAQRVASLREIEWPPVRISYRDITFRRDFPQLNFYKRPPFTIVTDEKFFQVEGAVRELQRLHEQFVPLFAALGRQPTAPDSIQVLFFSNEQNYQGYQRKHARHFENSAGFYSPALDRLVMYNQQGSRQVLEMRSQLDEMREELMADPGRFGGEGRVRDWSARSSREIESAAAAETRRTLRHEGAHQLLYTYGVHSRHRSENEWLIEGLATYFEERRPGVLPAATRRALAEAEREGLLMDLKELVNYRHARGFFALPSEREVSLAYAQSAALACLLMQPSHREGFFNYIRVVRARTNLRQLVNICRLELLCRYLGIPEDELQRRYLAFIVRG